MIHPVMREALEVHELLNMETIHLSASRRWRDAAVDPELMALLEKDARLSADSAARLQMLLTKYRPH